MHERTTITISYQQFKFHRGAVTSQHGKELSFRQLRCLRLQSSQNHESVSVNAKKLIEKKNVKFAIYFLPIKFCTKVGDCWKIIKIPGKPCFYISGQLIENFKHSLFS